MCKHAYSLEAQRMAGIDRRRQTAPAALASKPSGGTALQPSTNLVVPRALPSAEPRRSRFSSNGLRPPYARCRPLGAVPRKRLSWPSSSPAFVQATKLERPHARRALRRDLPRVPDAPSEPPLFHREPGDPGAERRRSRLSEEQRAAVLVGRAGAGKTWGPETPTAEFRSVTRTPT
jgi:hypothetical protein